MPTNSPLFGGYYCCGDATSLVRHYWILELEMSAEKQIMYIWGFTADSDTISTTFNYSKVEAKEVYSLYLLFR